MPSAESKGAQTRRAVLDAAISRFGRDGFRATSVADIARDAGVGGTVPYAYFPNKEALFLAAADEDAAGLIGRVVPAALDHPIPDWPLRIVAEVLAALGGHPLAHRILAGLEPEVTVRVLDTPALAELRKGCAQQLLAGQAAGLVRPDIDAAVTASGVVTIMLSLLMSVVQIGAEAAAVYGEDIATVLRAAIEPTAGPAASTGDPAASTAGPAASTGDPPASTGDPPASTAGPAASTGDPAANAAGGAAASAAGRSTGPSASDSSGAAGRRRGSDHRKRRGRASL